MAAQNDGTPYTPKRGLLRGQTFGNEYQYRKALARAQGFTSRYAKQRAPKPIAVRTPEAAARLTPAAQEARRNALHVLSTMRHEPSWLLSKASREAHTTPATVMKYAGSAITKRGGRYVAKSRDRLYRPMKFLTPNGQITLDVRDSRTATKIAKYMNAVRFYAATGDDRVLAAFRGKSVRVNGKRHDFVTDLDVLDNLAVEGKLSYEDLYELAA